VIDYFLEKEFSDVLLGERRRVGD